MFCGVHFMAEVADILSKPSQIAILPDLAAGALMADMAILAKVERNWRELAEVLGSDALITPVTYINSAADLKAFCGEHGGIVCTSTNAPTIPTGRSRWREGAVLPDQHLGRWTGFKKGIPPTRWWCGTPTSSTAGSRSRSGKAKILLWKGHCSSTPDVSAGDIDRWREKHPQASSSFHPESMLEVCQKSDYVGSTEFILNTITQAPPGTRTGWWAPSSTW